MANQHGPEQPDPQPPQLGRDGDTVVPDQLRGLHELATRSGLDKLGDVLPPENFITIDRGELPKRRPRTDGGPIEHQWPPGSAEQEGDDPSEQ